MPFAVFTEVVAFTVGAVTDVKAVRVLVKMVSAPTVGVKNFVARAVPFTSRVCPGVIVLMPMLPT